MANYLHARPDEADRVKEARETGLVPLVKSGCIVALVNRRNLPLVAPDEGITAQDYVVGLEVLGFQFMQDDGGVWTIDPLVEIPAAWTSHALAITKAFGLDRADELFAFLRARETIDWGGARASS